MLKISSALSTLDRIDTGRDWYSLYADFWKTT